MELFARTFLFVLIAEAFAANTRMIKIECSSSNRTITSLKCWTRAYNRRSPVANIEGVIERKITDGNLFFGRYHRFSKDQPFRPNLQFEKVEVCKMLSGVASTPFLNSFVDSLKSINERFVDFCQLTGPVAFHNITLGKDGYSPLTPNGHYLINTRFYDDQDENIVNVSVRFIRSN